jgi:tetratricopeptide (TPR) repeat protein
MMLILMFFSASALWKKQIYNAYIRGNMDQWKKVTDEMEAQKTNSRDYIIELVNFQYGYIAWCIGVGNTSEARQYIITAEKNLKWLNNNSNKDESLVHAYTSAFYGFKIGLSKIMAPLHGPKSVHHAEKAIELDANNHLGYIQYGNSQYYMPAVFGGSKKTAIEYYQKAQEIMERYSWQLKYDWNYLNLLTLIAQSLHETGRIGEAKKYYEKILETEPEFSWVRDELFPEFLKQTGNE